MPEAVRRFAYTDELHERMALKEGKSMAEQDKQVQRAALTADGIVSTATELIERDGLATFTMRSLGRELGASAMAVYGYFPSREALLAAVLERFMDTADTAPIPGEAWDDTMRRTMSSIYRVEMAHPELSRIEVSPEAGKAGLARHTDRVVSLYLAQGMPEKVLTQAWALVDAYLTGFIGMHSRFKLKSLVPCARQRSRWALPGLNVQKRRWGNLCLCGSAWSPAPIPTRPLPMAWRSSSRAFAPWPPPTPASGARLWRKSRLIRSNPREGKASCGERPHPSTAVDRRFQKR